MVKRVKAAEIEQVAREKLGFPSLRPGQAEAVASVVSGRDTLVVQPTGSGKSAVYQIAGLMIDGATVIISPLIALQKDQVDSIAYENAAVVNSAQTVSEARATLELIEQGRVEYIFLAPEQLRKAETIERLQSAAVSLFVVDEAHCVSQWGHDFRPDYLEIGEAIHALGSPRILALTATASPEVRDEIVDRLGMRKPTVLVQSFDRPNISLRVDRFPSEEKKLEALVHRVRWADKPGIVYVATRKNAEELMKALAEEGVEAQFYHAGLKASDRHAIQDAFMQGEAGVIVATSAFGMGIDKANVRFVYHYDITDSLDAYYQEIGRAGRDGEAASAVLFYRKENLGALAFRTGSADEVVAEQRKERLQRMRDYADASTCRREILLRYFGEEFTGPCDNCDNCEAARGAAAVDPAVGTRREVVE